MIESLKRKISDRSIKIGVIGLGYVGLPFAVSFAEQGVEVIGFDIIEEKVNILNNGESYIPDIPNEKLKKVVDDKYFIATTDFSKIDEVDLISICVPTPLRKTKDPDISFIIAARDEIFKYIRKGHVIVLESTTYPGTTEELLIPEIKNKGFEIGNDVFVAFSPERIDPGN
ncbi:UDP-N-acetyl-D-glucosamine dehydrogenase, partial [bacterium]|nr:UDP-N-acetyl-D-glucosamine dehydrogenase [bacterium]